ncbi:MULTISPECIES: NAD(P)-binding domain-containing protein [unclassified Microbacterium]|uniref:NADPH-dependent F420 reductase n=1 Tax=unclassified Microbacterium TaxID=2609290 RepID=UPI00214BD463|nr:MULTISPECIES: NAD(P)-binding domain-containing protein [unclassified Microbacterium]MCR2808742.1 NAD(P)-binding domain-containing protein [Microbacterium sp. zg.B185]WIM18829.1 NAD(P)-binding domain-containing protein [Microbacterium sp. zg-B185]
MTRVGIIGAGHIGSTLARGLIDRGYDVVISNSREPESLAPLVAELGDHATAGTATDAATQGEFVIVAVPFTAYRDLPVAPLAGKIVVDTNNYYWERDGRIAALDEKKATSSGLLQEHLAESKVAKGFNHITAGDIRTTGSPAGTPGRRALATASDFPDAAALVAELYGEFGFDAVSIGPLAESWRVERDQPAYGAVQTRDEMVQNLARATR